MLVMLMLLVDFHRHLILDAGPTQIAAINKYARIETV
jgi:hypothetical protein